MHTDPWTLTNEATSLPANADISKRQANHSFTHTCFSMPTYTCDLHPGTISMQCCNPRQQQPETTSGSPGQEVKEEALSDGRFGRCCCRGLPAADAAAGSSRRKPAGGGGRFEEGASMVSSSSRNSRRNNSIVVTSRRFCGDNMNWRRRFKNYSINSVVGKRCSHIQPDGDCRRVFTRPSSRSSWEDGSQQDGREEDCSWEEGHSL